MGPKSDGGSDTTVRTSLPTALHPVPQPNLRCGAAQDSASPTPDLQMQLKLGRPCQRCLSPCPPSAMNIREACPSSALLVGHTAIGPRNRGALFEVAGHIHAGGHPHRMRGNQVVAPGQQPGLLQPIWPEERQSACNGLGLGVVRPRPTDRPSRQLGPVPPKARPTLKRALPAYRRTASAQLPGMSSGVKTPSRGAMNPRALAPREPRALAFASKPAPRIRRPSPPLLYPLRHPPPRKSSRLRSSAPPRGPSAAPPSPRAGAALATLFAPVPRSGGTAMQPREAQLHPMAPRAMEGGRGATMRRSLEPTRPRVGETRCQFRAHPGGPRVGCLRTSWALREHPGPIDLQFCGPPASGSPHFRRHGQLRLYEQTQEHKHKQEISRRRIPIRRCLCMYVCNLARHLHMLLSVHALVLVHVLVPTCVVCCSS